MEDKIRAAFAEIHADAALHEQTIVRLRKQKEKQRSRQRGNRVLKPVLCFASFAVLLFALVGFNLYFSASAYVSIDVNPSLQLTVNRFDRVIDAYAFNEEGKQILEQANVKGKTYSEATVLIMSCIERSGYLQSNALVSVSVQTKSSKKEQQLCLLLESVLLDLLPHDSAKTEIEIFPVTEEVLKCARNCNLSPPRYLAIQELMEEDAEAAFEEYRDMGIRQIKARTQEKRNAYGQGQQKGMGSGAGGGPSGDSGIGASSGAGGGPDTGSGVESGSNSGQGPGPNPDQKSGSPANKN